MRVTHESDPSEVEKMRVRIAALEQQLAARDDLIRKLEHNVEVFRRIAFGRGSEKRGSRKLAEGEAGGRQLHLWMTLLVEEAERTAEATGAHGTIEITQPATGRNPSKRRRKLPSHLPRVRTTYELSEEHLRCGCGCQMQEIGDTPVTVAKNEQGQTVAGRVWVYADHSDLIWYDFTPSRKRDGPARVLGNFRGYLQADAYQGYDQLFVPDGATEVACWAHARRKFVDAETADPKLAKQALDLIGALYGIERDVKDAAKLQGREPTADEVRAAREQRSVPQLAAIRAWLELTEAQILPRAAMAEPIRYCLNQWRALCRYVEDGRLHIDNNLAERALRHFAVGRKNWLFFQTEGGGKTGAVLASLLQTARAIGLDPRAYFRDVLLRIGSETDVKKLTPHGWKQHFAQEVADHHEDIVCRLRDHFAKAK